ncbi:hypothetical protein ACJX0J_007609, partial [Zea mays]
ITSILEKMSVINNLMAPLITKFNMLAADSTENTREQLEIYIDVFTFKRIKRDILYKRRFAITIEYIQRGGMWFFTFCRDSGRRKMPNCDNCACSEKRKGKIRVNIIVPISIS